MAAETPNHPLFSTQGEDMDTHYVSRDNFGIYARNNDGPGPSLMDATTLLGNDV